MDLLLNLTTNHAKYLRIHSHRRMSGNVDDLSDNAVGILLLRVRSDRSTRDGDDILLNGRNCVGELSLG